MGGGSVLVMLTPDLGRVFLWVEGVFFLRGARYRYDLQH